MHGSPVYLYDTALQYSSESPADFAAAFLAGFYYFGLRVTCVNNCVIV